MTAQALSALVTEAMRDAHTKSVAVRACPSITILSCFAGRPLWSTDINLMAGVFCFLYSRSSDQGQKSRSWTFTSTHSDSRICFAGCREALSEGKTKA